MWTLKSNIGSRAGNLNVELSIMIKTSLVCAVLGEWTVGPNWPCPSFDMSMKCILILTAMPLFRRQQMLV